MAGPAVARGLTGEVIHGDLSFRIASFNDDGDIRRLLRDNPIGGRYRISLEREPDAFGASFGLARSDVFIIAQNRSTGAIIGLCERVVREAFVDGVVRPLPYIGALRVAPAYRHRIAVVRGGFDTLRALAHRPGDLPFALTSITSDNSAARRLLTAGVPGLPVYHPLGDFSTFVLRPRRCRPDAAIQPAVLSDYGELASFLNRCNSTLQFAQVWSEAALRGLQRFGLLPEHVLIARRHGTICGCLAVWDQRGVKQTVVRQYPHAVAATRPLLNLAAPLFGLPKFPPVGVPFRQVVLSHVAVADDDHDTLHALLNAGLHDAKRRGFDAALIGFATERPWRAALLQHNRALEYQTSLYLAHWSDGAAQLAALEHRTPHPELGLL
jgi:hypothetical protein